MAGRQAGNAHHMHIVFNGHFGRFLRRLKHRADVHIKTDVRIRRGHHLDAPVMTVLSHLGYQKSRAASCLLQKRLGPFSEGIDDFAVSVFRGISAGDDPGRGNIAAEYFFHGVGDFAHGRS